MAMATFHLGSHRPVATVITALLEQAGDLNGDGLLDYIWMSGAQGNISLAVCMGPPEMETSKVLHMRASPNFSWNPAIGDRFNNDGKLDFFSADNTTGSTFLGNGDGTFQGPLAPADKWQCRDWRYQSRRVIWM